MKTFFDPAVQQEFQARLARLEPGSPRQWGTMTSAQMLAHCTAALSMCLGDLPVRRTAAGLIGWMFKGITTEDQPFRRNVPTAAEFTIRDERPFEAERRAFQDAFRQLAAGPGAIGCHEHPFFGTLTSEQVGSLVYKHLDHHFRQFGV